MSVFLGALLLFLTASAGIAWLVLQVRSRNYLSLIIGGIFVASLAGFLLLRQEHYDWLNRDAFWHFAKFSLIAEEKGSTHDVLDALREFVAQGPYTSERSFGFARNELVMSLVHFSYDNERSNTESQLDPVESHNDPKTPAK